MTDAHFGALMILIGGLVTALFTYLGVRIKERISAKGAAQIAEINSQSAFVGHLLQRLNAVEVSARDCEARCADQLTTISQQTVELDTLRRERLADKAEIDGMQVQIQVLRRTNRRLEERILQMEKREGLD
jgi:hypothetical protein